MCAQQLTLAFAPIGGVSVVTRHARLAVGTRGEVTALLTHAAVHTRAVAITLACCKANGKKQGTTKLLQIGTYYVQ